MLPPLKFPWDAKSIWREKLKAERAAAHENRPDAPVHAARLFISNIPIEPDAVVALYRPIKDELDTAPLYDALIEKGARIALPVTPRRRAPLTFRRFETGDDLLPGRHGTVEPGPAAEDVVPDVIVAPMLGFTRAGARLGYGGGYYDRTLAALRDKRDGKPLIAVGYAYGAQEVDALPVSPLDQPLDWIVTERETIRVPSA